MMTVSRANKQHAKKAQPMGVVSLARPQPEENLRKKKKAKKYRRNIMLSEKKRLQRSLCGCGLQLY
jgi:hypothetical protein